MKEVAPAQIGALAAVVMLTLLGGTVISTFPLATDVQPASLVTVNVYMPETNPETVVVPPVPVLVTEPGLRVNVHVPLDGKPLNATLPVAVAHVGCVSMPTTGALGVDGAELITTSPLATEVQPASLVTVNV